MQRAAAEFERALLDPLEAARLLEVESLERLACQLVADRAQGGLHDAARRAEDGAGAGGRAERAVELRLGQLAEGEADVLDELDEFARRQHDVDVRAPVAAELRAGRLELLRRAGHDGHRHDVLDVDAGHLGVVRLGDGAEDAHRRLRRREVGQAVTIVLLDVVDPARAARGHHRQHAAMLQAVEELCAFLHDREIRAEVRVEDFVEAEEMQGRDHLSRDDGARLHAEGIAQGDAHRRRDLHDDVLLRVLQRVEDLLRVVLLDERARRADEAALAAEDAVRCLHRLVVGRRDDDVAAAPRVRQRRNALHVLAGADAAAAADALRRVAHDGGIRHDARLLLADGRQRGVLDVEAAAEALQVAVLVARAGEAVLVVVGEHELQDGHLRVADDLRVCVDLHALPDLRRAGREQAALADDLDRAEAAARLDALILVVAEVRDVDAELLRRLHDLRPLGHGQRDVVDGQMDHLLFLVCHFRSFRTHARAPPISKRSGKTFMADSSEFCAVSPRPQSEDMLMTRAIFIMIAMSSRVAVPAVILSRMILMWRLPSRHGVHWPQLSSQKNS